MRTRLIVAGVVAALGLMRSDSKPELTAKDIDEMMRSLSNWGRWGKEDQLGALNLITPRKRKQAAALVKEGAPVSLSRNAVKTKKGAFIPFEHKMLNTGQTRGASDASDTYFTRYHGFSVTHLDALCHQFYQGKMYNGFSQEEVTAGGAARLSVIQAKQGILTKGVLMDMPRLCCLE